MSDELAQYLEFAKKIAPKAGEIMLKYFALSEPGQIEQREKPDLSIVTVADEEINQLVIDEVEQTFPNHSVYGEEASSEKNSANVWVCDPINGTLVYSKHIPVSVFSLAFVRDGQPLVGVVYDPFQKRLYEAVSGQGAYLNGKRIHVSQKDLTHKATLDYH